MRYFCDYLYIWGKEQGMKPLLETDRSSPKLILPSGKFMSLSVPIVAILTQFRLLFTDPTWKKAMTLLPGTLLAQGLRIVTVAL